MKGVTKVTPLVIAFFLGALALGTIPIARANLDRKPTAKACTTPSSCPKTPIICYAPVAVKRKPVVFAAVQKTYPSAGGPATPAGFDQTTQLNPDAILQTINTVRTQAGLPAFEKNDAVCAVAAARAGEIPTEVTTGRFHSGLYARKLPYWITENMKYGSNEGGTVSWWLHSPIHRRAILGDSKYSCGSCVGNACIQLFTSFVPKSTVQLF